MMIGRSSVGAAGSGTMVGPYLGSGGKYQTVPGLCGALYLGSGGYQTAGIKVV
jgi:hypothetical protein